MSSFFTGFGVGPDASRDASSRLIEPLLQFKPYLLKTASGRTAAPPPLAACSSLQAIEKLEIVFKNTLQLAIVDLG